MRAVNRFIAALPADAQNVRIKYGMFEDGRSFYDLPQHPPGVNMVYDLQDGKTEGRFWHTSTVLNGLFPETFPFHGRPIRKAEEIAHALQGELAKRGIEATVEYVGSHLY